MFLTAGFDGQEDERAAGVRGAARRSLQVLKSEPGGADFLAMPSGKQASRELETGSPGCRA
jgi:hypothetical protein